MRRIVFVNLHANEMLVKTMPKYVFKQSVAIKHRYLLQYLLNSSEYEICSYINEKGFDLFNLDKGGKGVITKEKRSKSSIERSVEAHQIEIIALYKNGTFYKEFNSIMEAAREL